MTYTFTRDGRITKSSADLGVRFEVVFWNRHFGRLESLPLFSSRLEASDAARLLIVEGHSCVEVRINSRA